MSELWQVIIALVVGGVFLAGMMVFVGWLADVIEERGSDD